MRADSPSTSAATVWPSTSVASRAWASAGRVCSAMSSRRSASLPKSAFLATKSVSQSSSSSAPSLLTTMPLVVERSRRLPTSLAPLTRRNSTALSKSPSASVSAFLQSIMPAPVASRRRLTSAAVNSAMSLPLGLWCEEWGGRAAAPPPPGRDGDGAGRSGLGRGLALGRRSGLRGGGGLGRSGLGGRSGVGCLATGQELALPVGQRLVATDDRLGRLAAAGVGLRGGAGHDALGEGVGDHAGEDGDAADGVVVARDLVVDLVGVAVGVEDRDDRDVELARLADGDVLLLGVHDPDGAGHLRHVADTAEAALELGLLAAEDQLLLLVEADQGAGLITVLAIL